MLPIGGSLVEKEWGPTRVGPGPPGGEEYPLGLGSATPSIYLAPSEVERLRK
jgi:hypothetical protein